MLISLNPPREGLKRIIEASSFKAAKWLKETSTGNTWYWPAEQAIHADIAKMVNVDDYTKGIAVTER